jgi:PKD repeat protein
LRYPRHEVFRRARALLSELRHSLGVAGKQLVRLAALAALAPLVIAAFTFEANAQPAGRPPFPELTLPANAARGQQAIDQLGSRLPEVAAWYRTSPAELTQRLRTDRSLWVDRNGRLFYAEEFPLPPAGTTTSSGSSTPTVAAAPFALDQTFLLHSKPGSKRVIYLDFYGHTATGTAWNNSYGLSSIASPPFDLDGSPYVFGATELERIQYIWQRVAEDFAPFDVDVTTQEPPADVLQRTSSGDDTYGVRVVITKDFTATTASPCGCGGFAYVGIFDSIGTTYQPAYVFYDRLGSSEKNIAEAISHEVGHTVGLSHDGSSTTSYYSGHGTGETGWAPIMGVGYSKNLVQWSKGEYPNANNKEDDFAVMQANGLALRPDDHGDTSAAATALSTFAGLNGTTDLYGSGLVGSRTDVDVFSFYSNAGALTLNIVGGPRATNVDLMAELRDAGGNLIATANPVDGLTASIVTTVAGGQYFLTISGVGKGDLTTGYSDYASVGQYTVTGNAPSIADQPPVAVASASPSSGTAALLVSFSSNGSGDPDGQIVTYEWNFGDGSPAVFGPSAAYTYGAAGTYQATLKVTDNSGLTSSKSMTISVTPPVVVQSMRVESIAMSLRTFRNGNAEAIANVLVTDANGNLVPGAVVTGTWKGVVSGAVSATTGSNGVATSKSPRTKASGTFTFEVTGITLSGYTYAPAGNKISTGSITR